MGMLETLGTIADRLGYQEEDCRCEWRNLGFLLPQRTGALSIQERLLIEEARNIPVTPKDIVAKEWAIFGAICSCRSLYPWWTEDNYDLSRQIVQKMEDRGRKYEKRYLAWLERYGEENKPAYLTTVFNRVRIDLYNRFGKEVFFDHQKALPKRGGETEGDHAERKDRWIHELTGIVDGERFHARPNDHAAQSDDRTSFHIIAKKLIPELLPKI